MKVYKYITKDFKSAMRFGNAKYCDALFYRMGETVYAKKHKIPSPYMEKEWGIYCFDRPLEDVIDIVRKMNADGSKFRIIELQVEDQDIIEKFHVIVRAVKVKVIREIHIPKIVELDMRRQIEYNYDSNDQ